MDLFKILETIDYKILINQGIQILISSGLVLLAIKLFFKGTINNIFNKRLEKYKHELTIITKETEFDHQRKIQDFNLYTTERHKKYVEFYELLLISTSKIFRIYGFQTVLSFDEFNENDLRKYLLDEKIAEGKIEEIISLWNSNKNEGIKEMKDYLKIIDLQKIEHSYSDTKNYYLKYQLYFSDDAEAIIDTILKDTWSLFVDYQSGILYQYKFDLKKALDLEKNIKERIENLKSIMKKEMSRGYYIEKAQSDILE